MTGGVSWQGPIRGQRRANIIASRRSVLELLLSQKLGVGGSIEPSRLRRAVEAASRLPFVSSFMRRSVVTPTGDVEASSLCIEVSSLASSLRRAFTSRRRGQGSDRHRALDLLAHSRITGNLVNNAAQLPVYSTAVCRSRAVCLAVTSPNQTHQSHI